MKRCIAVFAVLGGLTLVPGALAHNNPPPTKPPCPTHQPPPPPAPPPTPPPCNCPAGPAGPAGPPGVTTTVTTTIIVHDPPPTCTSQRKYAFRVKTKYNGHLVVGVTASEPGQHPWVRIVKGRRVVRWSTVGQVYPKGGVLKVMGIKVRLAGVEHPLTLRYFYRPCAMKDGRPNDESVTNPNP